VCVCLCVYGQVESLMQAESTRWALLSINQAKSPAGIPPRVSPTRSETWTYKRIKPPAINELSNFTILFNLPFFPSTENRNVFYKHGDYRTRLENVKN